MNKLILQDLDVKDKKILMRVEFNVPLDAEGNILDDTRIRESLPSIQYVLQRGGSVIALSHLGRPIKGHETSLSLTACAKALSTLLHHPVIMAPDCIGAEVEQLASHLKPGQILLLENLRFYPAEEDPKSDPTFAQKLAALGDAYVNDAFGAAHRAHSSTATITQYFPHQSAAGFLMQKEVDALESLLLRPKHPFFALIGGAKISTKIRFLLALAEKTDALFIGGGMAYPMLAAQGYAIGDSLCEAEALPLAETFLKHCKEKKLSLFLPKDLIIADAFADTAHRKIIPIEQGIPIGWQGMDIGPQTIRVWIAEFKKAASVFWNGPVGVFEFPHFAHGTHAMAQAIADLDAVKIVGGGDSTAAINQLHLASRFTHVSTGGGASLEFIEKGHLPGIDALSEPAIKQIN